MKNVISIIFENAYAFPQGKKVWRTVPNEELPIDTPGLTAELVSLLLNKEIARIGREEDVEGDE